MDAVEILMGKRLGWREAYDSVLIGIVDNPTDARAEDGDTASFSVSALGANLTYQWQYSTDGGETWANSAEESATAATLSFTMDEDYDGYKYRCIVSGDGGSVTSAAATLYFFIPIAITTQPVDYEGVVGDTVEFSVVATGINLSYQWQYRTIGATKWYSSTMTGNKTDTLTMEFTEARLKYEFRCEITDKFGDTVFSDTVHLVKTEGT